MFLTSKYISLTNPAGYFLIILLPLFLPKSVYLPLRDQDNYNVFFCSFVVFCFLLLNGKWTKVFSHFHIYPAYAQNCIDAQKSAPLMWICSALKFIFLARKPFYTLMLGFFFGLWVQTYFHMKAKEMYVKLKGILLQETVVLLICGSLDHRLEEPCSVKLTQFDRAFPFISCQFICYSGFIIVAGALQWAVLN